MQESLYLLQNEFDSILIDAKYALSTKKDLLMENEITSIQRIIDASKGWQLQMDEYSILKKKVENLYDSLGEPLLRVFNPIHISQTEENLTLILAHINKYIKDKWVKNKNHPKRYQIRRLLRTIRMFELWKTEKKVLQAKNSIFDTPKYLYNELLKKIDTILICFNDITQSHDTKISHKPIERSNIYVYPPSSVVLETQNTKYE